LATTKPSR